MLGSREHILMAEEKLEATSSQDQTEWAEGHLWEKEKSWVPLAPLGISQAPPALPAPLPHLGHPPTLLCPCQESILNGLKIKEGFDKIAALQVQAECELSLFFVHTATSNERTSCTLASKIVLVLLVLFLHLVSADKWIEIGRSPYLNV